LVRDYGLSRVLSFTKDVHNALHGEPVPLARECLALHADVAHANGAQAKLETYDLIIVDSKLVHQRNEA